MQPYSYVTFRDLWFPFMRAFQVALCINSSFFLTEKLSVVWVEGSLFHRPLGEGHLACLYLEEVKKQSCLQTFVYRFLCERKSYLSGKK
jgi:hypothetical protein